MKLHIVGASNGKEIFRSFLKYKRQVPNAVPKITSIRSHSVPRSAFTFSKTTPYKVPLGWEFFSKKVRKTAKLDDLTVCL